MATVIAHTDMIDCQEVLRKMTLPPTSVCQESLDFQERTDTELTEMVEDASSLEAECWAVFAGWKSGENASYLWTDTGKASKPGRFFDMETMRSLLELKRPRPL